MTVQIAETFGQRHHVQVFHRLLCRAAVQFQTAQGGHEHGQLRVNTQFSAFDVEEFLGTQVGTESGLCHDIVAQAQAQLRCHQRVAAVGDVGERTAVYYCGRVLCGLHQVRLHRVFQQCHDAAGDAQLFHRELAAVLTVAQQDVVDALAQVLNVGGQAEDGHDL